MAPNYMVLMVIEQLRVNYHHLYYNIIWKFSCHENE